MSGDDSVLFHFSVSILLLTIMRFFFLPLHRWILFLVARDTEAAVKMKHTRASNKSFDRTRLSKHFRDYCRLMRHCFVFFFFFCATNMTSPCILASLLTALAAFSRARESHDLAIIPRCFSLSVCLCFFF